MITKHISLKEKKNGKITKNWEMNLKDFIQKHCQYKDVKRINKPWYVPKKVWDNIIVYSKNRGYNEALIDVRVELVNIINNDNVHTTKLKKRK